MQLHPYPWTALSQMHATILIDHCLANCGEREFQKDVGSNGSIMF